MSMLGFEDVVEYEIKEIMIMAIDFRDSKALYTSEGQVIGTGSGCISGYFSHAKCGPIWISQCMASCKTSSSHKRDII